MNTDRFKIRNDKLKEEIKNKTKKKIKFQPPMTVNNDRSSVTVIGINNINIVTTDGGKSKIGNVTAGKESDIMTTAAQHGKTGMGDNAAGNNINVTEALLCETPTTEKPFVCPEESSAEETLTVQLSTYGASRLGLQIHTPAIDSNPTIINYNKINIINFNGYNKLSIQGNALNVDNMQTEELSQMMSGFKNK